MVHLSFVYSHYGYLMPVLNVICCVEKISLTLDIFLALDIRKLQVTKLLIFYM